MRTFRYFFTVDVDKQAVYNCPPFIPVRTTPFIWQPENLFNKCQDFN